MRDDRSRLGHLRFPFRRAVAFTCFCITPWPLSAQIERPVMSVSMYFVSEAQACRPEGYPDPNTETLARCEPLTFQNLETMVRRNQAKRVERTIPPEELRLGDELLGSIDAYRRECPLTRPCRNRTRRYALILAFDVDVENPSDYEITIRRKPPTGSRVERYSARGTLSGRGRWVNHQRADVFLPSYGVRWRLDVGSWSWDLGTMVK